MRVKQRKLVSSSDHKNVASQSLQLVKQYMRKHRWVAIGVVIVLVLIVAAVVVSIILAAHHPKSHAPLSSNPAVLAYQNRLPELKKAVEKDQKNQNARQNYAVALYATGDYKDAISQYQKLTDLNPTNATAFNNLANAYRDDGQIDKAIDAYNKSISLDKTYINAYANLANVLLYTKNDSAAAIATYKKGLAANQDNSQLEILLGVAYEQVHDTVSAHQTYLHILSYDTSNSAAKAGADRTGQ